MYWHAAAARNMHHHVASTKGMRPSQLVFLRDAAVSNHVGCANIRAFSVVHKMAERSSKVGKSHIGEPDNLERAEETHVTGVENN